MTCEEALRIFKGNCSGCFLKDKYCKDCKTHMAIEALEKQIPKKPKQIQEYCRMLIGVCPNCGVGMNSDMNNCDNCGQALDWSDAE